jgi:hypothetical protein
MKEELTMTRIMLTRKGKNVGVAVLHDIRWMWFDILELCYPKARSITRTNEGWSVEIE